MSAAKYPLRLRLRAARVLADLTQTELAAELGDGYERSTVSNMEAGLRKRISPTEVVKWARATGVPYEFFTLDIDGLEEARPADPFAALEQLEASLSDARRRGLV